MKAYLASTPPWLGSKRKIARQIMHTASLEGQLSPGDTIADAFSGGAAVSLAAKALGYRVLANDMSPSAVAVAKALVENSTAKLEHEDMMLALTTEPDDVLPPEKELSLPHNCREVLARIVTWERTLPEDTPKRWLARAWITKLSLSLSMWGIPVMSAGRREWDELTPGQAQQLGRTGKPMEVAQKVGAQLNQGVFTNGQDNLVERLDATEFAKTVEAEALYLDPPYPGVLSYEKVYVGVNKLLEPDWNEPSSDWSAEDGWKLLSDVFDAAIDVPLWVVSMGTKADAEAILKMITDRDREASLARINHRHVQALKKAEDPQGDELLIVGKAA